MALTPAEEKELQELKELVESGALDEEAPDQFEKIDIKAGTEPTMEQAAGLAVGQGLSAGLADEFIAVGTTINKAIDGQFESVSEAVNDFNATRRGINEAIDDAQAAHPGAFIASDIAASTLQGMVLPAAQVAKTTVQAGMGFVEGATRSKGESILEITEDALVTAIFGGISGRAGKAAGSLIEAGISKSKQLALNTVSDALGILTKTQRRKVSEMLARNGSDQRQFVKDIFEMTLPDGGKFFRAGQTLEDTVHNAKIMKTQLGTAKREFIEEADVIYGGPVIDGDGLVANIRSKVLSDLGRVKNPDRISKLQEVSRWAETMLANRKMTIADLDLERGSIIKDISEAALAGKGTATDQLKKEVAGIMREIIDSKVSTAIAGTGRRLDAFKSIKRQYAAMDEIEEIASTNLDSKGKGFLGTVRDLISFKTAAGATAGAAVGQSFGPVGSAIGGVAGGLLVGAANAPQANSIIAKSMVKISNALSQNPTKFSHLGARIGVAAGISDSALLDEIATAEAEIDLDADPVRRTIQDVMLKGEKLVNLISRESKDAALALRDAIVGFNSDEIGAIMSELSRSPQLRKFVEGGIGWDGKVYSSQDMAIIQEEIRASRDLTPKQKLQMEKQLFEQGVIPTHPEEEKATKRKQRRLRGVGEAKVEDF